MARLLGKAPPKHDPRTLRLATYLATGKLPRPPASTSLRNARKDSWPMHANDRLGCCTVAAGAHASETWITSARKSDARIPDDAIEKAYSAVSGYDPDHPETDRGAVYLDVVKYWRTTGIGGHQIEAFVAIDLKKRDLLRTAIHMFGGVQIGAMLPTLSDRQIDRDQPWTGRPDRRRPDTAPGSWGGHAMYAVDYDPRWVYLVTWGRLQQASWQWIDAYVDEAYACLDEQDWITDTGKCPSGFDLAGLREDLRLVAA